MQKLIKLNGNTPEIIDNLWQAVESVESASDDADTAGGPSAEEIERLVAAEEALLLPLSIWEASHTQLAQRTAPTGIALENTSEPTELPGDLNNIALITIPFPLFTDGRGYSLARILRQELGYKGEIRAVGDVLHDQLFLMYRCGFDAFALKEGVDLEHALTAFSTFSVKYQASVEEPMPLFARD